MSGTQLLHEAIYHFPMAVSIQLNAVGTRIVISHWSDTTLDRSGED